LRVDRREIGYLKFIIEAYEGMAVVTTVNSEKGIIFLTIAPGWEEDTDRVLKALQKQILMESLPAGEENSDTDYLY